MVDIQSVRLNERVKAIAGMGDNASVALFIAAVVKAFTKPDLYVPVDTVAGLVLAWMGWAYSRIVAVGGMSD